MSKIIASLIGNQKTLDLMQEFEKQNIAFAYLFGSAVTDRFGQNSDLDFALYFFDQDAQMRFEKKLYLLSKLESICQKKVDIVVLNDFSSYLLLLKILKEGRIIYEKDSEICFKFRTEKLHEAIGFIQRLKYVYR
jgi:predicted nucleotidyltransferase